MHPETREGYKEAGVVGVELGRSDGEATCCKSAERLLASPMGKTPESKLA
jgi:hypothetical protein